jgi:hypothetical protein
MLNANLFVHACVGLLDIKKPVEIRMRTHPKGDKRARCIAAWYEPRERKGKVVGHVIVLNLTNIVESGYNVSDVIAHEICHAAQMEHGIFDDNFHHDAKFQALCKILRKECKKLGFPLGRLYDPKVDTE